MEKQHETYYIPGTTPEEQERLSKLNTILNEIYLQDMEIPNGSRILDIGSGLGQLIRKFGEKTGPGGLSANVAILRCFGVLMC